MPIPYDIFGKHLNSSGIDLCKQNKELLNALENLVAAYSFIDEGSKASVELTEAAKLIGQIKRGEK